MSAAMARLAALLMLALLAAAPRGQGVSFQPPGQSPMLFETRTVQGAPHLRLDDLVVALRAIDPQMSISWDSTQTLRLRVLGTRVSLFTDSASMLVEARLHRTDGPLVNREGEMLVPATVLRDLFERLPAAPEVAIALPEPANAQVAAPAETEPEMEPVAPVPEFAEPEPEAPLAQPALANLPAPRPAFTAPPEGDAIALVVIPQHEGDQALLRQTVNDAQSLIRQGTGRPVEVVEASGDWDQLAVELQALGPVMVIGLQVGHSSEDQLRGAGVFHMSAAVDHPDASLVSERARRYRAGARLSEILALHLEHELRRTEIPWLGRLPLPHRLLRLLPVPAAVVEVGQAGNADEADALAGPGLSATAAGAIAQAVIDFHSQIQRSGDVR